MIETIVGILVVIGVVLFFLASRKPAEMHIFRELQIKANPEAIFPYLNNSQKMNLWMPWSDEDPLLKMEYSGPEEGVGSTSSWNSRGKMGTGSAMITDVVLNQVVKTKLTYVKPMSMSQMAEVSLKPVDGGTLVRWSVTGKNAPMGRLMCVFIDMDKMIGGSFLRGLQKLKGLAEGN